MEINSDSNLRDKSESTREDGKSSRIATAKPVTKLSELSTRLTRACQCSLPEDELQLWQELFELLDQRPYDVDAVAACAQSIHFSAYQENSTASNGEADPAQIRTHWESEKLRREAGKLSAEAKKQRVEAEQLDRSFWMKPRFIFGLYAGLLALIPLAAIAMDIVKQHHDNVIAKAQSEHADEMQGLNTTLVETKGQIKDLRLYKAALETIAESGGSLSFEKKPHEPAMYKVVFDPPPDTSNPSKLEFAVEHLNYLEHVPEVTIDAGFYRSTLGFFSEIMENRTPIRLRRVILKGQNPAFDTKDLLPLEDATHLTELTLTVSTVDTLDLRNIARLELLEKLNLAGTNINDRSLAQLKGLQYLQDLDISDTQITTAGAKHLQNFIYLENLTLKNTRVNSTIIEHLKGLDSLKMLDVEGTAVDDALLESLKDAETLKSLETLVLTGSKVNEKLLADFPRDVFVIYEKPKAEQRSSADD